eukprot:538997-Pyramimonas_sp.AAC.1
MGRCSSSQFVCIRVATGVCAQAPLLAGKASRQVPSMRQNCLTGGPQEASGLFQSGRMRPQVGPPRSQDGQ